MPRQSSPNSLFGQRLRAIRTLRDLPQDQLGVRIGLDEGCSSARISRYETGTHQPPFAVAEKLAQVLAVPVTYFYCEDDVLAQILLKTHTWNAEQKQQLLDWVNHI